MRSGSRRPTVDADTHAKLVARVEALEDRVRRLEALIRGSTAAFRSRPPARSTRGASRAERPRCPGCTLELPRGRRGEQCVWCGFHFAAARRLKGR